jgi:hypothetical protein
VPISVANELVQQIIELRGPEHLIIDASGIMRSANVDIPFPYDTVSHFHLLAGPNSPSPTNMAVVRGKNHNPVYEEILINAQQSDVQIIETTTEEHDTVMAVVQGLTHAVSLILSEQDKLPLDMIERRNKTPARTGAEMIVMNTRVRPVVHNFIHTPGDFSAAFEMYLQRLERFLSLHNHTLDQFSTPYFRLLRQHAQRGQFDRFSRDNFNETLASVFAFTADQITTRIQASKKL